jgi:hypothetical protein
MDKGDNPMVAENSFGDTDPGDDFNRNPNNLIGSVPNACANIPEKVLKIAEQRERILESFMAEHAGILPSQIRQVVSNLPNGDIAWHLEVIR